MDQQIQNLFRECSLQRIIGYVEGDLSPREEVELEIHFSGCSKCAAELNVQKKLLCALDYAFDGRESTVDVPDDFTKVVVTSAESNVRGLRRPQERFKALMVVSTLVLLVLAGLGGEIAGYLEAPQNSFGPVSSFGAAAFHFIHDAAVGIAVILRYLGQRFLFTSALSLGLLLAFFMFTSLVLSKYFTRQQGT